MVFEILLFYYYNIINNNNNNNNNSNKISQKSVFVAFQSIIPGY